MNELKNAFSQMPEVQRIHELEHFIDNNKEIKEMFKQLKEIQKHMVNAKEFQQQKQYLTYKEEYDKLYQKLLDFPFVEEYLELLNDTNNLLLRLTSIIEIKVNQKIKE